MNELKVKIKKEHPDAVIPSYAKIGDAGMDMTAVSVSYDEETDTIWYDTGLAFEIPEGYVMLLFCRSSIYKKELLLTNAVPVIDSGYRGTVKFVFKSGITYWGAASRLKDFQDELNRGSFVYYEQAQDAHRDFGLVAPIYSIGDRIGQLIILPYPQIQFEEAEQLSETERGTGGYGHTGN
jgi:dUTP pyrophosphatase